MFTRRTLTVGSAVLAVAVSVFAQSGSDLPAFEVVSIKPRTGSAPPGMPSQAPDRLVSPDTNAAELIQYAYGVQGFQIIGGPDWLRTTRLELSAKADGPTSDARMRLMVRRLLAERFALRVRTETRQMGTYALVVAARDGRLGDRMKPSTIDCQALIDAGKVAMPRPGGPRPLCAWRIGLMNGLSTMWVDGIRMARFATLLEPMAMRSITDKTGLAGTYDIDLQFLADRGLPIVPVAGTPAVSNDVPPLFTALQDQLGLKLESSRGAVNVVIVEQVQMPTPN